MVTDVEPDVPIMTRKAPIYLGLLDLASVLKDDGFEVIYLPLNLLYVNEDLTKVENFCSCMQRIV
jgi:hypothetical protein